MMAVWAERSVVSVPLGLVNARWFSPACPGWRYLQHGPPASPSHGFPIELLWEKRGRRRRYDRSLPQCVWTPGPSINLALFSNLIGEGVVVSRGSMPSHGPF